MKRCPVCADPMFRRKAGAVEVDGCPSCGGLWLDGGELKALAQEPSLLLAAGNQFAPGLQAGPRRGDHACPACRQPLVQFEYDQFRGVRLDRCKACGGVWLDHGEAQEIARRLQAAAPPVPEQPPEAPGAAIRPQAEPAPASRGPALWRSASVQDGAPILTRRRLLGGGAAALVGLVLYVATRPQLVEVGEDASHLPLQSEAGRTLGDYHGKVLFLSLFHGADSPPAGCPNSRMAAGNERALREKFADRDVVFLAVNIEPKPPAYKPGNGWALAHVTSVDLYHQFFEKQQGGCTTTWSFPAYVVLGRDGRVVYSGIGNRKLEQFVQVVEDALAPAEPVAGR